MSKAWKEVSLGEILKIERGGSPRPITSYLTDSKDGINWVKIGDTKGVTKYIYQTQEKIKPEGITKSRVVHSGDFILSNSMSFGKPYIMRTTGCIHDGWLVLRKEEDNINEDFLYYLLGSNLIYQQFSRLASGSTVKNLNINLVKKVKIPLPPIEEQKRIADILDRADAIRQKRKRAIELTEELARSTFLDMFGDPFTNPKGWEKVQLNELLSIVSGQIHPQEQPYADMLHIGGENIESNTGYLSGLQTPRELSLKSGKYLFQPGDVLYCKIRPYLNKVVMPDFKGVCSSDIYSLRVNDSKLDSNYLVYLLRSKYFLNYAKKHSSRTNIPKINRSALLQFSFPYPPIALQKQFSNFCIKLRQTQSKIKSASDQDSSLFNSLLQRAFKGEL